MMIDFLYWVSEHLLMVSAGIAVLATVLVGLVLAAWRGRRGRQPSADVDPTEEAAPGDRRPAKGGFLVVPSPAEGSYAPPEPGPWLPREPETRLRLRSREIRESFHAPVPRIRRPLIYPIWLAMVALTVVMIPLLYLALIGGVGYFLYWYAFTVFPMLIKIEADDRFIAVCLIPLLMGLGAIISLLQPLVHLLTQRRASSLLEVSREREPLLFCLIEEVCRSVGAPAPKHVYVDCQGNAAAGFRRGLWSALVGRDLTLVIGLPLAATLRVDQFAGILAHEFGHFRQGLGLLFDYVVHHVNGLLEMLVHPPGSDDEEEREPNALTIGAKIFMFLARGFLWLSLKLTRMISGGLMREQEYDADKYEAMLAGSDAFVSNTRHLLLLAAAADQSYKLLRKSLRQHKGGAPLLAEDFPQLIVTMLHAQPPDFQARLLNAMMNVRVSVFDTHPTPQARIRRVQKLNAPGVFHLDRPATDLFHDFRALCVDATLQHYRQHLGPLLQADALVPNDRFLDRYADHLLLAERAGR